MNKSAKHTPDDKNMDSEHKPGIFASIFLLPAVYGTVLRNDILRLEARQQVLKSSFATSKKTNSI